MTFKLAITLFALVPLLSTIIFIAAAYKRLTGRIILGLVVGFIFLSLILGQIMAVHLTASYLISILYTVLFCIIGLFPIALQRNIQFNAEIHQSRKRLLQNEVLRKKLEFERWVKIRTEYLTDMDQTTRRYAFAKSLVSHMEENAILADLFSVFSSEKIVLGIAFSKTDQFLQDSISTVNEEHEKEPDGSWNLVSSKGWINEEEWKKILKNVKFPIDSASTLPLPPLPELSSGHSGFSMVAQPLSLVSIPIKWDRKVRGLLTFLLRTQLPKDFLNEVSVYSQLLGLGLHKASLYRMVVEHSRRDGLTNLYLRRILMERLNEEIAFTKRYGTSFSVLMLDLDHFKSVNDTYGHQVGDHVLKNIADCLSSILHPGTMISRYGGEEFAVLIGLAPANEVMQVAENVRTAIEKLEIAFSENKIKVTGSIGVAHYLPDPTDPKEFIHRADTALYWAKESGRNCVKEWKE